MRPIWRSGELRDGVNSNDHRTNRIAVREHHVENRVASAVAAAPFARRLDPRAELAASDERRSQAVDRKIEISRQAEAGSPSRQQSLYDLDH
jgi:hypothetical protein